MSRTHRRIGGVVAAVLAALLLWAFFAHNPFTGDEVDSARAVPTPSATPTVAPTPRVKARPAAQKPGQPDRIVIPALDVDSAVVPIRAKNRVLDPPADADVIGWWSEGVAPGSERGSALLTGHTIHTGQGALKDLETVKQGATLTVHTSSGDLAYVVDDVHVLSKEQLASRAESLFDQTSDGRLVVITCEDWDGTAWESNVVVTALPA